MSLYLDDLRDDFKKEYSRIAADEDGDEFSAVLEILESSQARLNRIRVPLSKAITSNLTWQARSTSPATWWRRSARGLSNRSRST